MSDRLTIDETVTMIETMADLAERDSERASADGNEVLADYWEGWADGLRTLNSHINTGVKVTCFPNCSCHPQSFGSANGA